MLLPIVRSVQLLVCSIPLTDRFNERFGVPTQESESAYRPTGPQMCMDTILCFRHSRRVAWDNTVKHCWRTLQLLPGIERLSYAGSNVEVIEMLDGQLVIEHHRHIIPSQEAPPRPGILRSFNERSPHEFVSRTYLSGLGRMWTVVLASLDAERATGEAHDDDAANGALSVRSGAIGSRRKPTPIQIARWNAVQKPKYRGLSIRGIARELGIRGSTAKKNMEAESPPLARARVPVGST